ncbi:metallophosphoesterase [Bacteroides sp.]|uniref:metallophosphoesterase n=1 Tax=Bacteroides sp. TaxID=29523 RepID=UPI001B557C2E|nr:metallophosphoesterase [Bacteroides sp.]MBP6065369.1 metallophosphoesterase [Bacteroides sp.]MBP6067549.1 metallophosphoesterase [Bacteroides sp.]MBP6936522.1 metallophosphoesterase [Bacteroides sp.]MBP8622694.1 metallophosphoesterase [Bacteroides sp.]MBP9587047.1 metallophosphoesterase [Bacteroides sp.]
MKERRNSLTLLIACAAFVFVSLSCYSCNDDDDSQSALPATNPFDLMSVSNNQSRDKVVVISDIHLGADLEYSETVKHLSRLEQFLMDVRYSTTVKELVIAGDLFDEWYVPTGVNTYRGGTQADFIKRIVSTNQPIFDVFNGIIQDGHVKLVYAPGNHDLTVTKENVELALPGVTQARDTDKLGLGTYVPQSFPEVAIEHSNRYDFFCAPSPYDNQEMAPGSILNPGYFFSRIATNSFLYQVPQEAGTKVPTVALNNPTDPTQVSLYLYYKSWKTVLENLIWVGDKFDDKIIKTNINGYTDTYSIGELLPYNHTDGSITVKMFQNSFTQNSWEKRLKYCNVPVMTKINDAIVGSLNTSFLDGQSNVQYFQNPNSKTRIVVFGHTHIPMIKTFTNPNGQACVYANTGTWVDRKFRGNEVVDQDVQNMDFVVIAPRKDDSNKIYIGLCKLERGIHKMIENQTIVR